MTIEHPNTKTTFSTPLSNGPLPPSAANVCERLGSQSYSRPIPTSTLSTPSHPLLSPVHELVSRAILLVELSVLITPLPLLIPKSSMSQFKPTFKRDGLARSQIFLLIASVPQLASHQSIRMMFKLDGESYSIFLPHKVLPSMMAFPKNMAHLSMKLSMMQSD